LFVETTSGTWTCDIASAKSTRVLCEGCTTQATNTSYDVQGVYLSADVERGGVVLLQPLSNCPEGFVYKLQGDVWLGGLGQGVHLCLKALASLAAKRTNVCSR